MGRLASAALAASIASGCLTARAEDLAHASPERMQRRMDLMVLVNGAQRIWGAASIYASDRRRPAIAMGDLFDSGLLKRDELMPSPAARPGAAWRLVRDGGNYAEMPLATMDIRGPECREISVLAGIDSPNPQFFCHAGADGVSLRFGI